MRILITNEELDRRAGSDLFVRDLARALQRLGHFVLAYGSDPREQPRLFERDSIAVATDLAGLPFKPDIIHARHHLDAMTAVMGLPGVPAIHHCIGSRWAVVLPVHPRIYRHVVPSADAAHWVAGHPGVAGDRIAILPNPVDLQRFATVRVAPERPQRLLFHDDLVQPDSAAVTAVRAAAGELGLAVDVIGRGVGRVVDNPEALLPGYDIVCAAGRSAIEALATGCAVVIVGAGRCAGMVDPESFDRLHAADFSPAADAPAATSECLRQALAGYSAAACGTLAARIRPLADITAYAVRLEAIYREAIAAHAAAAEDLDAEQRAAGAYLYDLSFALKEIDPRHKAEKDVPLSAAAMFLDVSARLAAIQADLDKPQW